jgi:hypothetical protein
MKIRDFEKSRVKIRILKTVDILLKCIKYSSSEMIEVPGEVFGTACGCGVINDRASQRDY